MSEQEIKVVHYSNGWHGLSFYLTSCGLDDGSYYVTANKSFVTCKECLKVIND